MLDGIKSPLPPMSRCSKWRTTHSLRRGIHWACAVTSACTYSVASSACFYIDTTEHVLRPHTPARAHTYRHTQADTHAGYGIHLSSYVCAIINKSEIARLQTPRSEYQTSGGEGRERKTESERGSEGGGSQLATLNTNNKDSCHCNTWDTPSTTSG